MVNLEPLQKALNHVTEHPETHRQQSWAYHLTDYFGTGGEPVAEIGRPGNSRAIVEVNCNTAFCLAGRVVIDNGYTFVAEVGEDTASAVIKSADVGAWLSPTVSWDQSPMVRGAADVACEILGIGPLRGDYLFAPDNTLRDLWALGWLFGEGKIELPERIPDGTDHHGMSRWSDSRGTDNVPGMLFDWMERNLEDLSRSVVPDGFPTGDQLEALYDLSVDRDRELRARVEAEHGA